MKQSDTVSIHYKESKKSKKWMDKNVSRNKQSEFIRSAVSESIEEIKNK